MWRFSRLALVLAVPLLLSARSAEAQTRVVIPCPDGAPCSMQVPGHIDAYGSVLPWVASVAVPANFCFTLTIWSADAPNDISMTAIRPDGIVYRLSLTSGPDGVVVKPTTAGWYTVKVDSLKPAVEQIFVLQMSLQPLDGCTLVSVGR